MSKDKDLPPRQFDGTVLGLASLLHDEAMAVDELAVRLDRLRVRRAIGPPIFLALAATIASLFAYMIVRASNSQLDLALMIVLVTLVGLVLYSTLAIARSSTLRIHRMERELKSATENLHNLIQKVAQFEEFRDLPRLERFVLELRLARADKVLQAAAGLLGSRGDA